MCGLEQFQRNPLSKSERSMYMEADGSQTWGNILRGPHLDAPHSQSELSHGSVELRPAKEPHARVGQPLGDRQGLPG